MSEHAERPDEAGDVGKLDKAGKRPGRLSVVATPIGNLEDITLRALRTLREADVVLAENTRRSRTLCERHGIARALRSFHAHSTPRELERVLEELEQGKHIALVTDAGTPLVSDPGGPLVRQARERGLVVEAIPGPCAAVAALTVSGIACDEFRFVGFLPRSGKRRRQALAKLAADSCTTALYESPQRLHATLCELAELLRDGESSEPRELAVCRELTKLHEEVVRGSASELAKHFEAGARGEITIVISGRSEAEIAADGVLPEEDLDARIDELLAAGTSVRDAVRLLQPQTQLSKHELYARVQAKKSAVTS